MVVDSICKFVLPFPGDTNKYVLFHHTVSNGISYPVYELLYSIVDTLDNCLK